ncbi:peptidylprolyl isomerase [Helicobacter sp. MIT 14-3879]|uniref:FKBP-type peptidyl-prolyl cis-trans isomerase n=1 Tax=Helicobacter sp. MIT 14-3879 TaxID=2040649 RepID=UPI000E1F0D30|nr:peptidylprolyl isomerase [Helicobacter sp. MIT 14-3879]RDU61557.1 peptidylprolyl isomerase [Helicobacter sp. MIT 14-3879]
MIENNKVVSINYEVVDALTQQTVDSNKDSKPLEFIVGHSQVIEGLEKQIIGANIGDSLTFSVSPEQGYGVRNPELLQEVDREQFSNIELEKGMTLFGQAENGMPVQVIVADFNDNTVIIDYNHPLAGKTLNFKVDVLDARDATPDELIRGMSGGCGCSSAAGEHSGGCCGGGCGCH